MLISLTIALPTITPSQYVLIFFACSGPEIPNPTAHGMVAFFLMIPKNSSKSVVNSLLVHVTPMEDTQYKNPSASLAIVAIRSGDVGVTRLILSTP